MLIKIIYVLKIHSNQSINYFLMEEKKVGIENLKNPKAFTDYSKTIDDVYEKKRRVLIVFHDMIADMESNTKVL